MLDKEECERVSDLIRVIDEIFNKYGVSLSSDVYVKLPMWEDVVSKSGEVYDVLIKNIVLMGWIFL